MSEPNKATEESSCTATNESSQRKHVAFPDQLVSAIHDVPRIPSELLPEFFYSKADFKQFHMDEQARYEERMMGFIQEIVRETMSPKLNEAIRLGATAFELEAMMPRTTEEIFELLGCLPPSSVPTPPNFRGEEDIILTKSSTSSTQSTTPVPEQPALVKETEKDHFSDEDILAMFTVTRPAPTDEDTTATTRTTSTTSTSTEEETSQSSQITTEPPPTPITIIPEESIPEQIYEGNPIEPTVVNEVVTPEKKARSTHRETTKRYRSSTRQPDDSSDDHQPPQIPKMKSSDEVSLPHECSSEINELLGTAFSTSIDIKDLLPLTSIHDSAKPSCHEASDTDTEASSPVTNTADYQPPPGNHVLVTESHIAHSPKNKNTKTNVLVYDESPPPSHKAKSKQRTSSSRAFMKVQTQPHKVEKSNWVSSMEEALHPSSSSIQDMKTNTNVKSLPPPLNIDVVEPTKVNPIENEIKRKSKSAADKLWGKVVKREEQKKIKR